MMRVLHIISGDLWAGAEIMAWTLLTELSTYPDIELNVIVLNNGSFFEHLKAQGIAAQLFDESKLSFSQIFSKILEAIRTLRPDVIHSHRYKENLLSYLSTLFYSGHPALVSTQHGMPERLRGSRWGLRRVFLAVNRWLLANRFRMLVSVSKDIREYIVSKEGFSGSRVLVIQNGIKVPEYRSKRFDHRRVCIGSAGRFFPVKDYPLFVDVAKEVLSSEITVFFRIAGEGPEKREVESRIKRYGLTNDVCLSGFVEEMDGFYQDLDIYINTSLHEGIPMSVLEAMAHGLPVIAPKVGGFKEIITDGTDGYLVEDRNPASFAEKCVLLATDKDLRIRMSLAARKKVERHFSAARMAAEYYQLYQSILSR